VTTEEIIARSQTPRIGPGSAVTLHFSLILPGGQEIDSTRHGKPAEFVVGDGNLLPGFENALLGQQAGFAEQILLAAGDAFGEHNPANVQLIDRQRFTELSGQDELEAALVVSFQAPDGELHGVVVDVYEKTVKVDFNHPLSGKDSVFDVSVIKVTEPDAAEQPG